MFERKYTGSHRERSGQECERNPNKIIEQWRARNISLWPPANRKDERCFARMIREASVEKPLRFFAAVCPDYRQNSAEGGLGGGVSDSARLSIDCLNSISGLLKEHGIPYAGDILLADTEIDIPEIVKRLVGEDGVQVFQDRCNESVGKIRTTLSSPEIGVHKLTDFFEGEWHKKQRLFEGVIGEHMDRDDRLDVTIKGIARNRQERYSGEFGRSLSWDECVQRAIRHYAQYLVLGDRIRKSDNAVMINTRSPNLRAIRKPEGRGAISFNRIPVIVVE